MGLLMDIARETLALDKSEWHQEYVLLCHKDIQGNMIKGYVLQRKTPNGWQYRSMDMTLEEYQDWEAKRH